MNKTIPASFLPGESAIAPQGQVAHPMAIEHTARLKPALYALGDSAWSLVGNGLSNQNFVEGPDGLIVIDTGESIEEMKMALALMREKTSAPVVACIYTHFHYVNGTRALLAEIGGTLEIWGHAGIEANLRRFGGEVGPRGSRGLVHQFGVSLPSEGPDALLSCGLGLFLRNPSHAPFTPGYIPANKTFEAPVKTRIAGLAVELYPAPSDASDSITIWFPELGICINNLVWPALFNIFAIRGEEYRDPRVVVRGVDQIVGFAPDYLIGTHGPPLEGAAHIEAEVLQYRDAIQFIWDQTVRAANRGLSADEAALAVQLPARFRSSYVTSELYGVTEHHVRQIYAGLFGWFDEDESKLFPLPPPERAQRLIQGFGGEAQVREAVDAALVSEDYRWALELGSWLIRTELDAAGRADGGDEADRGRVAEALRGIARCSTSANVRNWCLTRALELEGELDMSRFRVHRFRAAEVAAGNPADFVPLLRVLLDPDKAGAIHEEVCFDFGDRQTIGLMVRRGVALTTSGEGARHRLQMNHETWAALLGGKATLNDLLADGSVRIAGDEGVVRGMLACFDHPGFLN
ncbi:MAG: alkyl sulfatase dimerization domain-containing protein [Pseudomonadota bacterium]